MLFHARRNVIPHCEHHPAVSEGDVWKKIHLQGSVVSQFPRLQPIGLLLLDAVKRKVYKGRRERFSSLAELKKRIRKVWDDSYDIATLRKAILEFRPRLQAVVTENSGPIKVHFG